MNSGSKEIEKWKPGVPKSALLLIAGIMWILGGIFLNYMAYSWLRAESQGNSFFPLIFGFICGLIIHHFGFLRVVDKNLDRILPMEGRRCVFSFISWKSYILIMMMSLMGFLLRHSSIPKLYIAVLYIGIGTALILSSVRYLRYLILTYKGR